MHDENHLFYVPSTEGGMDIHNEPGRVQEGAAYLGAGFNIKPVFEDHIGSLKAIDPYRAEGGVGIQEQGSAVGRRSLHRRRPGLHRHARGLSDGLRRQDRRDPVEVQRRHRHRRRRRSPGNRTNGTTWIGVAAGWGGAGPLRGGGEVAKTFKGINQGGSYSTFKLASHTRRPNKLSGQGPGLGSEVESLSGAESATGSMCGGMLVVPTTRPLFCLLNASCARRPGEGAESNRRTRADFAVPIAGTLSGAFPRVEKTYFDWETPG